MLHQLTSFHRHAFSLAKCLFLLLLLTPGATEANAECQRLLERNLFPTDATPFLEETAFQMNGQQFCLLGFETGLDPEALRKLYRNRWDSQPGEMISDIFAQDSGKSPAEVDLLFIGPQNSRRLHVINGNANGTQATLSIIQFDSLAQLARQDKNLGPDDYEIVHEQQTEDGYTVMIEARNPGAEMLEEIVRFWRHQGWQLDDPDQNLLRTTTAVLTREDQVLTVTTAANGNPHLALIQVVSGAN